MDKKAARIFTKEKILEIENRFEKEKEISASILNLIENAKKIIAYRADKFEVSLDFLDSVLEKEIYYPKIISMSDKTIVFVKPESWQISHYNIPEPVGTKTLLPSEADCIFIPALGYNWKGFRLGRGGGFYDRALEHIPMEKIIGLSFRELFSIDFTPTPFDLRVSKLILEKEILNFED